MRTSTHLKLLTPAFILAFALISCSGDDDVTPNEGKCLADKITLTETEVNDLESQDNMQITFDAKNTAAEDYDISTGARSIYVELKVTTTDNTVYTEEQPLLISKLAAGATALRYASCGLRRR